MQTYLEKCASYVFNKYPEKLGDICVVFPNRRAGLFFKKYLSVHLDKPAWAPSTYSIEDFIAEITKLQIIDNVDLIFELYDIHKQIEKENSQQFEEFIKWAPVMLADFNDIDEYLVKAESLYKELNETKAISVWNLGRKPLTEFEKNYIRFFNNMLSYYELLNEKLLTENKAYRGMSYRRASEMISDKEFKSPWSGIVFAGFNALSDSEMKIITSLINYGQADILWNSDAYYFENIYHNETIMEAGRFLYKHFKKTTFSDPDWIDNNFKNSDKEINIIGVPDAVGQVKFTGQLLTENKISEEEFNNTAVVLADESLLIPLLNSIPGHVGSFNVTMGLTIHNTPPFQLFESLFELNENAKSFADLRNTNEVRFNLRDILKVLNHPYVAGHSSRLFNCNAVELNEITRSQVASGKVFYSWLELKGIFKIKEDNSFFADLYVPWSDLPVDVINRFLEIINCLKSVIIQDANEDEKHHDLEIEYLFHYAKVIERIKSLLNRFGHITTISALHDLFKRLVKSTTIPFYGEPLQGLQVMGVLETRTLDFENVILLSANEDVLPASKYMQSFIPFDIRTDYNLPTYKDRDAVFAYHFYSLISRARNVFITYDTRSDALKGSDKSRFISQIQHELPNYNPKIDIREKLLSTELVNVSRPADIVIEKNEKVLQKLNQIASKGISASSLDVFRICSLRFYFKNILSLPESEEIEESIDAAMFGSVIHKVLENIFKPFEGQVLNIKKLKETEENLGPMIRDVFLNLNKSTELNHGKNFLILNVASAVLSKFINKEIDDLKILEQENLFRTFVHSEKDFVKYLKMPEEEGVNEVKICGIIDRLDSVGNILRIIDYKTGFVNNRDVIVKKWEDLLTDFQLSKGFQLLVYSWLSGSFQKKYKEIQSGIISLRTPSRGVYLVTAPDNSRITSETLHAFEEILKEILLELFNPSIPFKQVEDIEACKFCPYNVICNR